MSIFYILQPTHQLGQAVVLFLGVWVVFWIAYLIWIGWEVLSERRVLKVITDAISGGSSHSGLFELQSEWGKYRVTGSLLEMQGLSRLEAEPACLRSLLGIEQHFRHRIQFLQAILNLFVVIGLLGTLFGLADSLSALRPENRDQLNSLLSGLRSAFAPSIWGVACSILCGVLLAVFRARVLDRFLSDMHTAAGVWLKSLAPPFESTVVEAAGSTLSAAKQVVVFADSIRNDSAELRSTIKETVLGFQELKSASEYIAAQLTSGAVSLVESTKELRTGVATLREQIVVADEALALAESKRRDVEALSSRIISLLEQLTDMMDRMNNTATAQQRIISELVSQHTSHVTKSHADLRQSIGVLSDSAADVGKRAADLVREELAGRAVMLENTLRTLDSHIVSLRQPFETAAIKLTNVGSQLLPTASRIEAEADRIASSAERHSQSIKLSNGQTLEAKMDQVLSEMRVQRPRRWFPFWND
jgi:X-X-X-Leu-X-X-Gly heptad repeat protein